MKIHLNNNENGTSTGFIVTDDKILMVFNDKMVTFPNNEFGEKAIDIILEGRLNGESLEQVYEKLEVLEREKEKA